MEKLTLTERLEIESGHEILENFFNLLVENYVFDYEDDVYCTISYLNEESIVELYSYIYEGSELSDEFLEDLEKSYSASQSFLAEANNIVDVQTLAENTLDTIKSYLKSTPKQALTRGVKRAKKYIKRGFEEKDPRSEALKRGIQYIKNQNHWGIISPYSRRDYARSVYGKRR